MADPSLSSYPTAVDNFDRISDLDKDSTMIKAAQYKSYINSGNYTAAENYLKNNPDLKQCAISAEIVNKHSDAIVAIENDIKDNVKNNINALTQNQNDIKKNISDVENKLGYEINDITGKGVRLTINDEILDIYGLNRSEVYLKRGSSSNPDNITINTPYFICTNLNNDYPPGETISHDKVLHFKGSRYYRLYEACFYCEGSSFINFDGSVKCCTVSNTNWRNPDGSSKMPSEYYPFSIEGGIRMTGNTWYPFGYNKGSISVNAYFGNLIAGDEGGMNFIVECTGIDISKIECTCGIIKYYLK